MVNTPTSNRLIVPTPAPPALAATTATSALAAFHGTAVTGTALTLAKGVMHMMFLTKAKLAFVTALTPSP